MKNICFIVQEYYPKDPRVRKFVELLLSKGYAVDVICLKEVSFSKTERLNNLTIYRTGLSKKRGGLFRYLLEYIVFFIQAFFKVTALHFKKKYQLIHVNTLPDFLVFSAFIPKLFGAKILLDMHEIAPEFFQVKFNKSENHWIIKLLKWIEKISLQFANHSLTVTHAIKDIFVKRAIKENTIDVIMNVPATQTVRKNSNSDFSKQFNLVYHGTLTNLYSLDLAIRAVNLLKKEIPSICLNIYGEGQEEILLKILMKELSLEKHVIFHGFLSYNDMQIELSRMDIGILPIRRNIFIDLSFSNKLAEYVSLGIPVITTALPSVKYYFSDTSLFYFDGEEHELATVIKLVYGNPENVIAKINSANVDYEKISWNIMANRYLQIVEQMINTKNL